MVIGDSKTNGSRSVVMLRRRTLAMGRYIKSQGKVFNPTGDGKFANGTPDYSQSQSIGVNMPRKECSCASSELAKRRVSSGMVTTDKINYALEIRRNRNLDKSRLFHCGNTHFCIGANTRANCVYASADSCAASPKETRSCDK